MANAQLPTGKHSQGVYFFTLNLAERRGNDLLLHYIDALRGAFRRTKRDHPFTMEAVCILCWGSQAHPSLRADQATVLPSRAYREGISASRRRKGKRGIWQRRYWEHVIRDDDDYRRHMDYIHYNPVKHRYVKRTLDWPYSSLKRMVDAGLYPPDWCAAPEVLEADYE
ncbi:REP-associated tyrosine transposase [Candidatus Thiosymbion oneisti]|uniref:REP-associated tyrosine transposase n=1 Tax=Candidatus Thiosymbion oneisti TaxID=589554 RepID=UPI00114CB68A